MISRDIEGVLDENQVKDYVSGVAGAIEIIDSRYQNFKFSLEDVIADNCSSIGFVVGDWFPVNTPIGDLKIDLLIDGEVVEAGNSNDILGDPWKSLAAATRLAHQYNQPIKAGMYIMAGAATSAAFIKPNQTISTNIESLGSVNFEVAE
jgi:2-oxo-3-hexenedioate decarboxylase